MTTAKAILLPIPWIFHSSWLGINVSGLPTVYSAQFDTSEARPLFSLKSLSMKLGDGVKPSVAAVAGITESLMA